MNDATRAVSIAAAVGPVRWLLIVAAAVLGIAANLARTHRSFAIWPLDEVGWAPSFAFAFGVPLILAAVPVVARASRSARWRLYRGGVLGAIAAEFTQLFQQSSRFDWADVAALLIGAAIAFGVEAWLESRELPPRPR